jgi:hypothetical protein
MAQASQSENSMSLVIVICLGIHVTQTGLIQNSLRFETGTLVEISFFSSGSQATEIMQP